MADLETRPTEPDWPLPHEEVLGDRNGVLAWLEYLALRGAMGTVAALPESLRSALTGGLARVARRVDRRHSDSARRFLEVAFGSELTTARREELVLAAWRHLFTQAVRDVRLTEQVVRGPGLAAFETTLSDDFLRLQREGGPSLFVSGHFGAWEAAAVFPTLIGFRPLYIVSRPPRNVPLSRYAQRARESRGYRVIHRHGAIDGITRVVRAGGHVGLLLDQRARGKTVLAPFFGRPAHSERSVSVLIRRLKVPLVFGGVWETDRPYRYEARFERVIWPEELARATPEQVAGRINAELERMILTRPEQYFWLHDRYRKAPPSAARPSRAGSEAPKARA